MDGTPERLNSANTSTRLTAESWRILLERLSADPAQAAREYEKLRLGLIRLFRWRGCTGEEDLADVALDRLARRLTIDGSDIRDVAKFAAGIARMLAHEQQAHARREHRALTQLRLIDSVAATDETEPALPAVAACLGRCLEALSPADRELLERYYTGDASQRIANRRSLAQGLGMELNALRNKALRLRRHLEACVERCLRETGDS